ncbi:hypothetical protein AVEN_228046-1 [Araneus ventricosus]|uniref:Uncharacterized protein n=1 Tax=Araneus ventricosus TaxID=182803 RepID=A0A4Y2IA83_ARAVE|nr:hypothetical protein AVEN_228046-1 [Araneus ventricosus]
MWTPPEKAQCVACFIETKSDIQVQRTVGQSMEENHHPDRLSGLGIHHLWQQVVFSINRGQVAHLFQTSTLHLDIGLCLYEPGYTKSFLMWRPHFSVNLRHLESKKT